MRDQIARRYGVAPLELDEWPANEVEIALTIMRVEVETPSTSKK